MAFTENSPYAAVENRKRKFFGLQFHPEVVHTPKGKTILGNFVHKICGCGRKWTMRSYIDQAVEDIRAQVGKEHVILGLSGGVDSSVAAALIHKAIGKQLTCIFVNNGVLRANEAEAVKTLFKNNFKCNFLYEDTAKLFLKKLKGVTDPRRSARSSATPSLMCFKKPPARSAKPNSLHKARCIRMSSSRSHRWQPCRFDQEPPQCRRPAQGYEVQARRTSTLPIQR